MIASQIPEQSKPGASTSAQSTESGTGDPTFQAEASLGRPPWWLWPTILSLDAPSVCLAWQWLFSQELHADLRLHQRILLGSCVWLAYAADRWIEAWRLPPKEIHTHRHQFAQRWRWPLLAAWLGVLVFSLRLAIVSFTRTEWLASLGLLVATVFYLLIHQWLRREHLWRLPKELCVALLISTGSVLYPALGVHASPAPVLEFSAALLLVALCNCSLIAVWEEDVDRRHRTRSLALLHPAVSDHAGWITWGLSVLLILLLPLEPGPTRHVALASSLALVLLGSVHACHKTLGRRLSRVLADVALLTPLLFIRP